jgi:hypothetical protein
MVDQYQEPHAAEVASPISISHFARMLRAYLPVIGLAMLAVAVGYLIVALALYLFAPSQRLTTQTFRVDFEGAANGRYPNGAKFSSAEIISTPVLLDVFNRNDLQRFTTFSSFSQSIFVLESNTTYEALAADYQARLSDPRLTSVDRERIQREYELKRASLAKNEFSLNYLRTRNTERIPETVVRKVLSDILGTWANLAVNHQHVTSYKVQVLSPELLRESSIEEIDQVIGIHVLRTKIMRVIDNLDRLRELPAADMARTRKEQLSLLDLRLRLEEIVRFRLEPLMTQARSTNSAATLQFLTTQLAYDQRLLAAQRERSESILAALTVYAPERIELRVGRGPQGGGAAAPPAGGATGESVTPVISDSFFDRLVSLATSSADRQYRQQLVDDYREATLEIVPLEQAVADDEQVLAAVRAGAGSAAIPPAAVEAQIERSRLEVREAMVKMAELHRTISNNLNPSTHLYTATGTPTSRLDRGISVKRLGLFGVLTMLIALPLIVILALLHGRMREEEGVDFEVAPQPEHAT